MPDPENPTAPTPVSADVERVEIPEDKRIYRGNRDPHTRIRSLPPAPSWRAFRYRRKAGVVAPPPPKVRPSPPAARAGRKAVPAAAGGGDRPRGSDYYPSASEINAVNLALYLRRPLLIKGGPGTGKTSLAHAVAYELGLGDVLVWPITSRTSLQQGLYHYDALGHLQDVTRRNLATTSGRRGRGKSGAREADLDIGRYLRLGPLGTALRQSRTGRPCVLLIDEIDKSDIDLPNDLLHLFEEGHFEIPELARLPGRKAVGGRTVPQAVEVFTHDEAGTATITGGQVYCDEFPIVFLTSNNERDFPPAFLRRCLALDIQPPDPQRLAEIVRAAVSREADTSKAGPAQEVLNQFLKARDTDKQVLATDQLLNAMQLVMLQVLNPSSKSLTRYVQRDLREGGS